MDISYYLLLQVNVNPNVPWVNVGPEELLMATFQPSSGGINGYKESDPNLVYIHLLRI